VHFTCHPKVSHPIYLVIFKKILADISQIILFYRLQNTEILFARKKNTNGKEKMKRRLFLFKRAINQLK